MKKIITYGTFDLFHIGHLNLIRKLHSLGDQLIIGVSTDEFNQKKGKKSIVPFEHRYEIISSLKYVDVVIPETCWEQKISDIQKYGIDIFAIGDDWAGKFDFLREYCEVVYIDRTPEISTSYLKEIIGEQFITSSVIPKDCP